MRFKIAALVTVLAVIIGLYFFIPTKQRHAQVSKYDPWTFETTTPDTEYGTYLGNGHISTRAKAEGLGVSEGGVLPCYLEGFYDKEYIRPIPTWSVLSFYTSERMQPEDRFALDPKAPYRQKLDMKNGVLETWYTLRHVRRRLKVYVMLFVSRDQSETAGLRVSFVTNKNGPIWIKHSSDVSSTVRLIDHSNSAVRIYRQVARTQVPQKLAAITYTLRGQEDNGELAFTEHQHAPWAWCFETKRQRSYKLEKIVVVTVSKTLLSEADELRALHKYAQSGAFENLLKKHKAAWNRIWKERDIIIEGDPEAQQIVHSNMFYLLESVHPKSDWSIAPCGLSNNSWGGQLFWDADTWMFPALLPQFPEYAKSILDYRFKTLNQARINAKLDGHKGASYAWQSGYTGSEQAPEPYLHERHITADVAQAYWQYYLQTGDKQWLATKGYPVISATADYWTSRVVYNAKDARYEIKKVVSPDENAGLVNNSAYTNAMMRKNLVIAIAVSKVLHKQWPHKWDEVAQGMWIPYDSALGRYIEYEGYSGKPTKQADTELLIFPADLEMSKQTKTNTFDYWSAKVGKNNPAMSDSVFAVISSELGRRDEAYSYFHKSYRPFLRGPFNYFNEKQSVTYDNACFLTGCAGSLQSVIYGFAGLRIGSKNDVRPLLPQKWTRLEIKGLRLQGATLDLTIAKGDKWKLVPSGESVSFYKK